MKLHKLLIFCISFVFIFFLIFSCKSEKDKQKDKIEKLEKEVYANKEDAIDKDKLTSLTNLYTAYAHHNPKDSLAPVYLYKASEISMNNNAPMRAISLLDSIIEFYPTFEKTPYCYFLKGFVYDEYLKNINKARLAYTEFIDKYPDHELSDDAQMSIKHLGKTNEEIILEFEKMRKSDTTTLTRQVQTYTDGQPDQ